MKCREVKDLLVPYLDREVNEKEKGVIAEHLSRCKDCREEMEDLAFIQRKVTYALKATVEERDCPTHVWAGVQQRLMAEETPGVPALSLASRIAEGIEMLKDRILGRPTWKTTVSGVLAVALIAGLALALPSLTGQQRRPVLALDPERIAVISLEYFERMSPALRESLQRGKRPVDISQENKKRILQAVPEGSEIGYVIDLNGTYHAVVMIEKGVEYVILAEVILEGDETEVVVFDPIPARHLFEPAYVEPCVGAEILKDIPPEMEERILQKVPGATRIISASIFGDTPLVAEALVEIEENDEVKYVLIILHGDKVEIIDRDQLMGQGRQHHMGEKVLQWKLRRDVLSVILVEGATGHIPIPEEAQERILQEIGGEIIFAITFNQIDRAVVRIDENGEPKYIQVILMGDKIEIGVAEVEYVEYIESRR